MLTIYDVEGHNLVKRSAPEGGTGAIWIDLINPTREEERAIEDLVGLQVPTREEMSEIEVSSRLYQEKGAHFMTATILYHVDLPDPQATAITFMLTEKQIITVRYAEPKSFLLFLSRAQKGDITCSTPMAVLLGLLEAIIDREADLVERLQSETEKLAQLIFDIRGGSRSRTARFDVLLRQIGRVGEITSRLRESLLSIGRLLTYLYQVAQQRGEVDALRQRIRTEDKDVQSLSG